MQDEIFGPVLSVGKFKTEEEGIKLANNTTYGLGAGLHSSTSFPVASLQSAPSLLSSMIVAALSLCFVSGQLVVLRI